MNRLTIVLAVLGLPERPELAPPGERDRRRQLAPGRIDMKRSSSEPCLRNLVENPA